MSGRASGQEAVRRGRGTQLTDDHGTAYPEGTAMHATTTRRRFAGLLGVAAVGALGTGCGLTSGGSSTARSSAGPPTGVDPSTASTLRVADAETDVGAKQVIALNRQFMRTYPNVRIERVPTAYAAIAQLAQAYDAPDVVEVNQGHADMGALVAAGALAPLDAYAKAYQWSARFPAALLQLNSFGVDGTTLGSGSLYGLSQSVEFVGLYYVPQRLARLGVGVPKTWAEWVASAAKIKRAGNLTLMLGNKDGYPATYLYATVQDRLLGAAAARDLVFGRRGRFDEAAGVQAAQTLQGWVASGFLPSNSDAVSHRQAVSAFAAGSGAYLLATTADADHVAAATAGTARFLAPPPATAGAAPVAAGGQGLAFAVTATSKKADVAAAYIDFVTGATAADVLAGSGTLPIAAPATAKPAAGAAADIRTAWQRIAAVDALVPYLDFATPTFYATAARTLSDLIAGRANPSQAAAALQADYSDFQQHR